MNILSFSKYQGTGNDFILADNRDESFSKDEKSLIIKLCNRRLGIGSDGLILIEEDPEVDFKMIFINPDGSETFCGNGSRCAVAFARTLGMIEDECHFLASDGSHIAKFVSGGIQVKMADALLPKKVEDGFTINTGTPHFLKYENNLNELDVNEIGSMIRYRKDLFGNEGVNVNFISETAKGLIFVRTFERGVEAETLSCGTGVTAAAILYGIQNKLNEVRIETKGGDLKVDFDDPADGSIRNIYLTGPVSKVYEGTIQI